MAIGKCDVVSLSINGITPECGVTGPLPTPPPEPPLNWSPLIRGLNTGLVTANFLDVAYGENNFVAVGPNGRAALSQDGGLTWTGLPQGLNSGAVTANFRCVGSSNSGVFVATGLGQAAISIDDGVTWSQAPFGLGGGNNNLLRISTDNLGNWCGVGVSAEAVLSTDNGVNWSQGGIITGAPAASYQGVTPLGPEKHFIVVGDNGVAGITLDSGATFGSFLLPLGLNSGNPLNDFKSVPIIGSNIVASGFNLLNSISLDGGVTWAAIADPALNSGNTGVVGGECQSDSQNVFVSVQENGYASYSPDRGVTWFPLPRGLNSGLLMADFNGVATDGKGTWVAVADAGYAAIGVQ